MKARLFSRGPAAMALRLLALALLAGLAEAIIVAWRVSRIAEVDSWLALCAAAFVAGATAAMRLFPVLILLELLAAAIGKVVNGFAGERAGRVAACFAWGVGAAGAALWVLTWYERFAAARIVVPLAAIAVSLAALAFALGSSHDRLRRGAALLALLGVAGVVALDARTLFGQYPTLHVASQWLALAVTAATLAALGAFRVRPPRNALGALAICLLVAMPLHWGVGVSVAERTTVRKLGWLTLPQAQLLGASTLNPACEGAPDIAGPGAAARAGAFLEHANFDALPRDLAGRNLILVVMDAVRADRVGAYGAGEGLTPNIDALARKSVLFENAYASSSGTIGTLGAMFCMAPPSWVEMTTEKVFWRGSLGKGCRTIAERLSTRGYGTHAHLYYYVMGTLSDRSGFLRGFERVTKGESDLDVVNNALMSLEAGARRSARPQFVWLQLAQAHEPYTPSPGHAPRDGSEEARYDASLSSVDAAVGELEAGLRRLGLWRNSVLVLLSDHGEEFGDHGGRYHNRTVYDEMLRVPLIVHDARVAPRRVPDDVVLGDLGAWLLWEHGGVPQADVVARVASSAGLLYRALGGVRVAELLSNTGIRVALIKGPRKAMRNLTSRYDELYDRARDPGERRNLAGEGVDDPLLAALDRYEALRNCTRRAHVTPIWGDDGMQKIAAVTTAKGHEARDEGGGRIKEGGSR